ncbi:hypothetical protein TELCIR_01692 [Teladorsagia circumcincta]|uniref:GDSL-like protein n=1 Tax=Teladorsagia circumcincta TaxID=45464 RepID=A0A2G9V173_TELCI|nr:hypothetical protein TELCIR_01692 [Teladorsagia circumcincta]
MTVLRLSANHTVSREIQMEKYGRSMSRRCYNAMSGAKSGQDNFYFEGWSGVGWQVTKYLENNLHLSGESLIVFQAGGVSDYFTGEKDTAAVVANIEASIENITKAMSSGTLLVLTLLDLGNSPGVRGAEEGGDLEQRIGELVAETNRQLGRIVFDSERGARRMNPKLQIRLLDINPYVMEAMNSLNITEPFTYQTLNVDYAITSTIAHKNILGDPTVDDHHQCEHLAVTAILHHLPAIAIAATWIR